MKKIIALILGALLWTAPASAVLTAGGSTVAPPAAAFPCTVFNAYANGWQSCSTKFFNAIYLINPAGSGAGYPGSQSTISGVTAYQGYGGIYGVPGSYSDPTYWPETYGGDSGELLAAKNAGIWLIGGVFANATGGNTNSIQSIDALIASVPGSGPNFIGTLLGDEPGCSSSGSNPAVGSIPTIVSAIAAIDSTHMNVINFGRYGIVTGTGCDSAYDAANAVLSFDSNDVYAMVDNYPQSSFENADQMTWGDPAGGASNGNDLVWVDGLMADITSSANPTVPYVITLDGMNDGFGVATDVNYFGGTITNGSKNITLTPACCTLHQTFSSQLSVNTTVDDQGLTNCIPANDNIDSVSDSTHAVLHVAATCSITNQQVNVTGGGDAGKGCWLSYNMCWPNNNEIRITAPQYHGEVWASIISGAYGKVDFGYDGLTGQAAFSMGGGGSALALTAASSIKAINAFLDGEAPIINRPRDKCSMQNKASPYHTSTTCTTPNGVVLTTSNAAVPMLGMVISPASGGGVYFYIMTDRRHSGGATLTANFGAGYAAAVATLCWDSRGTPLNYDSGNAKTPGATISLNGSGIFSDTIGTGGNLNTDDYNVLKYAIGRAC